MGDEREPHAASALNRRAFLRTMAAGTALGITAGIKPFHPSEIGAAEAEDDGGPVAQWAMVIDLARCDGCGLCTKACQEQHFTGEQEWIKVFELPNDDGTVSYFPRPCMQCENAPCLNVCPVGATFNNKNGTVLIDHERCIGCRLCMAACPYGARSFNWGEPENPPGATFAKYSPEYPVPHRRGTVEKCMFCAHNAKDGKLPVCASACSMNAIWFGDLARDIATNGAETKSLSLLLAERNAFRLKEELGTRPRVWYLPGHGENFNKVPPL